MLKKSFLLKVSSVDSQKMITKYTLVGAWQMQKKNPKYNVVPIRSPTLALVAPRFLLYLIYVEYVELRDERSVTANIGWYVVLILHDQPSCNVDITWLVKLTLWVQFVLISVQICVFPFSCRYYMIGVSCNIDST